MELKFRESDHSYTSINDPEKVWTSVTTLISLFKEPFDKQIQAEKSSKNKRSKWYGLTPERIIQYWDDEATRANTMGTWYHNQRENEVISCNTIRRDGVDLPIFTPTEQDGFRISPDQRLLPGIYPEHFTYLKSAGICGQADRIEVIGEHVHVYDYKTNKKIDREGFTNWEGITKKLKEPVNHLDDCNLMHYALQLSFYMYIILKHNHNLKPGKLAIHHVLFEIESEDQYGFPNMAKDSEGNPIIKEVVPYEIPYLKDEVISILNYIKLNPEILKTAKK